MMSASPHSLELIAGGNPDIVLGTGGAGFEDGIEGIGFGGADLAGFFPDSEGPGVSEPSGLGGQTPGFLRDFDFGADSSR